MPFCILAVSPVTLPQGMPDSVKDSSQSPDICTMARILTWGWSRKTFNPQLCQPRL